MGKLDGLGSRNLSFSAQIGGKCTRKKNPTTSPLREGVEALRQHKIFSETLNRFLMAAPRCARARCAGVNTVSVDRQLRQSEVIEKFPYSLCVSPERFPVAVFDCPARQCPTVQHLQNLILKKAEGNLSDSLPRRLPLLLDCQAPVGEASSKVPECGRLLCANCRRIPLDRVCRVRSTASTSTGTSPRSKTARSVSPREGSRVSNRNCSWGQVDCSNSKGNDNNKRN